MIDRLLHTPEGVRDIHLVEASRKNELQNRIMSIFHSYGFKDVQTPTFEYIDIFSKEKGTVDIKMMYKFFDRDGNILALRPDITPSIARLVASSYKEDQMLKRICYLGNTYRNNESYQGKLREVTQAGIELIGVDSADADAEIIAVVVNSLLASGLKEFQIDLGLASFFKGIVEEAGLDASYEEELRRLIDDKNYIAIEEILLSLNIEDKHKSVLLDLPKLFGSIDVINKARSMTANKKALDALDRLANIYKILTDYGIENYISIDLGIVSQINYYTGIVFRGYTYGTGVAIADGGRYDSLIGQFGYDTPAVGFVIIIDELMSALERQEIMLPSEEIHTLLIYNNKSRKIAIGIAESMRSQEMNIEIGLLDKDIATNIEYGKKNHIGGIMHFISEDEVELINLTTDERYVVAVEDLFEDDYDDEYEDYDHHHHHHDHCGCGCHHDEEEVEDLKDGEA